MWPADKNKVVITMRYLQRYPDTPFFQERGIARKPHLGVDFAPKVKDEKVLITSPVHGTVIWTGQAKGYGIHVKIKSSDSDKDYIHLLAHLEVSYVKYGQKVEKGTILGYMGSTGYSTATHCHYEIRKPGSMDRVDPSIYMT